MCLQDAIGIGLLGVPLIAMSFAYFIMKKFYFKKGIITNER